MKTKKSLANFKNQQIEQMQQVKGGSFGIGTRTAASEAQTKTELLSEVLVSGFGIGTRATVSETQTRTELL